MSTNNEVLREKIGEPLFDIWSESKEIESINDSIDFVRTYLGAFMELRSEYKEDLKDTRRLDKLFTSLTPILFDHFHLISEEIIQHTACIRERLVTIKDVLGGEENA